MFYLAIHMALFLLAATLTGIGIGWWLNHLKGRNLYDASLENDTFSLKHRLDKCFDENALLRRNLKDADKKIRKLGKKPAQAKDGGSDDSLQEKLAVLMDDLQMRDDTIIALEKELAIARKQ